MGCSGGGHRRLPLLRKPPWRSDVDEWQLEKGWGASGATFFGNMAWVSGAQGLWTMTGALWGVKIPGPTPDLICQD